MERPATANPSEFAIKRSKTEPGYERVRIRDVNVALKDAGSLSVAWQVDVKTTPQFSYHIKIFDNRSGEGKPLAAASHQIPHARSATVDVSTLKVAIDRC